MPTSKILDMYKQKIETSSFGSVIKCKEEPIRDNVMRQISAIYGKGNI